jgi:hypothetical protein
MIYRFTSKPVLSVYVDFNHYLPTDLPVISIGKLVIPTGLPILDFSNAKFEFGAVFDRFLS